MTYAPVCRGAALFWDGDATTVNSLSDNTSIAAMKTELNRVREQGYAVTKEEWRSGVWSIAAPIFGPTGAVVAGIGISGPADRIRPRLLKEFKPIVMETAAAVSERMGARLPAKEARPALPSAKSSRQAA